ncbi:hypothetical protein COY27_02575 [Candidatus Woesearchaeota archaeon CG_4_10_14_0_2_um_filter_33_13]|nr:MAG: hypothetical protein COY27_02575 [Candidatus Woesearchaeota archaeon CG_4_10_14_0_2_um_filter_33_13]
MSNFSLLNTFKNIFSKINQSSSKIEIERIENEDLEDWLEKKISQLPFHSYLKDYFSQLKSIKEELNEQLEELKKVEVSKEHKNVQERVKNIVFGHKEKYIREMERFNEQLLPIEKKEGEKFSSLQEYQEAVRFNQELDQKLDQLAKNTAKSYQASQHLFFDKVEEVFKSVGEVNILVKDFKKNIDLHKIEDLRLLTEKIQELRITIEKKSNLENEIKKKEIELNQIEKEKTIKEKKVDEFKKTEDYKNYLSLLREQEQAKIKNKGIQQELSLLFSKVNRPLKKYAHFSLDSKLIDKYLDNAIEAFDMDKELKIKEIFEGMDKNWEKLNCDDKQKNVFLDVKEKINNKFLEQIKISQDKYFKEEQDLKEKINNNSSDETLRVLEHNFEKAEHLYYHLDKEIKDQKQKLERINLEEIKNNIEEKIKKIFTLSVIIN